MKISASVSALFAFSFLAISPAHAALDASIVPADSRWVVHVDLNALRATSFGKDLVAMAEKMQLNATQGAIALDVPKVLATVGNLTAYGANFSKDPAALDGTLVARGTPDLRKIAESLLLQGTLAEPKVFSEVKDLPFPAYAIAAGPPASGGAGEIIVAFPPEPVVIVSKSRPSLLRARELLRGSGTSLAKASSAPLKKLLGNSDRAYLFSASLVPAEEFTPDQGAHARILKMANAVSVAVGENADNTFARAELAAIDEATADKLMKILQGMTAMLSLAESSEKQLGEFLNATQVSRNDRNVSLALSYPTARLVTMVENFQKLQNPAPRPTPNRNAQPITRGRTVSEWTATESSEPDTAPANASASRTIENVELKNGATVSLGWRVNGGRGVNFSRVEIAPVHGGAPMIFRSDMMRTSGNRGSFMSTFPFPGADGTYTLKVTYTNDPDGKANYAVSVRDPQNESAQKAK